MWKISIKTIQNNLILSKSRFTICKANFITTTNSYCNLSIYDLTGRKVQEIFNGWLDAGEQTFEIKSNQLKAGIYFVKLEINDQVRTSKLVISH